MDITVSYLVKDVRMASGSREADLNPAGATH